MRPIDADSLKSVVNSRVYHNHNGIIKIIDEQPTINAVSSVHAHWIRTYLAQIRTYSGTHLVQTGSYKCSNCGRLSMGDTNYCGGCGAKMDEKDGRGGKEC